MYTSKVAKSRQDKIHHTQRDNLACEYIEAVVSDDHPA